MTTTKKRRLRHKKSFLKPILAVSLLLALCCFGILRYVEYTREAWKLILVNSENPLPENYTVELTELANDK